MVVIVFGLPGSGKSYFASRLAKRIDADYINSDRLRKEMFKMRTYSQQEKESVYQTMLQKMKQDVAQNKNVVLDATFHTQRNKATFYQRDENEGRHLFH